MIGVCTRSAWMLRASFSFAVRPLSAGCRESLKGALEAARLRISCTNDGAGRSFTAELQRLFVAIIRTLVRHNTATAIEAGFSAVEGCVRWNGEEEPGLKNRDASRYVAAFPELHHPRRIVSGRRATPNPLLPEAEMQRCIAGGTGRGSWLPHPCGERSWPAKSMPRAPVREARASRKARIVKMIAMPISSAVHEGTAILRRVGIAGWLKISALTIRPTKIAAANTAATRTRQALRIVMTQICSRNRAPPRHAGGPCKASTWKCRRDRGLPGKAPRPEARMKVALRPAPGDGSTTRRQLPPGGQASVRRNPSPSCRSRSAASD